MRGSTARTVARTCATSHSSPGATGPLRRALAISQEFLHPDQIVVVDTVPVTIGVRSVVHEMRYAATLGDAVAALDMACYSDLVSIAEVASYVACARARSRQSSRPGTRSSWRTRTPGRLARPGCVGSWRMAGITGALCNRPVFTLDGRHVGTPDLVQPALGLIGQYNGSDHISLAGTANDVQEGCRLPRSRAGDGHHARHGLERPRRLHRPLAGCGATSMPEPRPSVPGPSSLRRGGGRRTPSRCAGRSTTTSGRASCATGVPPDRVGMLPARASPWVVHRVLVVVRRPRRPSARWTTSHEPGGLPEGAGRAIRLAVPATRAVRSRQASEPSSAASLGKNGYGDPAAAPLEPDGYGPTQPQRSGDPPGSQARWYRGRRRPRVRRPTTSTHREEQPR